MSHFYLLPKSSFIRIFLTYQGAIGLDMCTLNVYDGILEWPLPDPDPGKSEPFHTPMVYFDGRDLLNFNNLVDFNNLGYSQRSTKITSWFTNQTCLSMKQTDQSCKESLWLLPHWYLSNWLRILRSWSAATIYWNGRQLELMQREHDNRARLARSSKIWSSSLGIVWLCSYETGLWTVLCAVCLRLY